MSIEVVVVVVVQVVMIWMVWVVKLPLLFLELDHKPCCKEGSVNTQDKKQWEGKEEWEWERL